jgi:diaminopimelate decarboxylase
MSSQDLKRIVEKFGTPLYIYDTERINVNISSILNLLNNSENKVYYAMMCNNQPKILELIKRSGLGVQINSNYELSLAKKAGFKSSDISFTSTGISKELMEKLVEENIELNLDSAEEAEKFCALTKNRNFGIRVKIDKEINFDLSKTTNICFNSNVGIEEKDFNRIKEIAKNTGNKINGVHGYLASNVTDTRTFIDFGKFLVKAASAFPDLEYVNFGSGFGVKYSESDKDLEVEKILHYFSTLLIKLSKYCGREITLKIEPGRIILADAGSLLCRVTNIKMLTNDKAEISVDAGFAEIARPKIYNSYHEIENLENRNNPKKVYDIRGNTVLQDDFLGKDRTLEEVKEGDYLLIKKTGAYGIVMASGFPGKEFPRQIFISTDKIEVI